MSVFSDLFDRFRGRNFTKQSETVVYKTDIAFLDAYISDTDRRVGEDPHQAVGGRWEEIGQLQFNYLRAHGLEPRHTFLDIGCGTLRGGRYFIRYLNTGNYTGFEISPAALDFGRKLVIEEGLQGKIPRLVLNETRNLKFAEFKGVRFDYLLAQSVFTHLLPTHIVECFESVVALMDERSTFFFTFKDAPALHKGRSSPSPTHFHFSRTWGNAPG